MSCHLHRRWLVYVIALAIPISVEAEEQALPIEALMEAESIGVPVDLSPDGTWLAVPVTRPRAGATASDQNVATLFDRTIDLHELAPDRVLRLAEGEPQRDTPR